MSSLTGTYSGPSNGRSSKFKSNTQASARRRTRPDAFELNSRSENDFDNGKGGNTSNAYWGGSKEVADDDDSQKAVFTGSSKEIVKTVKVMVTDDGERDKGSTNDGGSSHRTIDNFDHV